MSKHYQFKVKRSNSTLLHVICIDNEGCQWQLRATGMRGSEMFVVKRFDDVHTCSIEIVQGHHRQAKSWMIGEHKGIEYAVNHVYPDAAFGICVQHLAANLKTRYKDFKGPLKTYFDGVSRSYLLSEFHRHMESIRGLNPDMHRYLVEADPTKWSRAYFNGRRYAIMTTNIAESFNNVDRKARLMPVGFLVEWLRALLQRWFVEKREEALKITSKLAPKAEKLIRTHFSVGLSVTSILLAAQMAGTYLKKSACKLLILPPQSVGPEGHGFVGFRPKVKNMSLFGVVDVMVMDTTVKHIPTQYPYENVQQQGQIHS
ncbi:hypothetical protein TIFTF001_050997 [Ficus carica]|uniref:Transposase MuDR plant domain-containing protein n=1 Tax=Ficus carica TaxID=3494 RepID=A0AA87YY89_FICCA|nr:hypothetical protein TIFTF001_050997 [Ficus carica]